MNKKRETCKRVQKHQRIQSALLLHVLIFQVNITLFNNNFLIMRCLIMSCKYYNIKQIFYFLIFCN